MPVTSVTTDPAALTITVIADAAASVERLWDAFADPRQLERFWGPPGYPTTFAEFELRPGGVARYWMTSPEGERYHALWQIDEVDKPHRIAVRDYFASPDGAVDESMPGNRTELAFAATDEGARLTITSSFDTIDDLEQVLAMGMTEGYAGAIAQLDVVLADLREYALGKGTQTEIVDDTHVRITRAFRAPRHLIWRAHTEPELMKRWLLGPDGWVMTTCELEPRAGGAYRYAWAPEEGHEGEPFGFEGETLVFDPERRMVSSERMSGTEYPPVINDLNFDEADGVTLLTLYCTYVDASVRDMILATGMTDGMETSYQRLERELLATS